MLEKLSNHSSQEGFVTLGLTLGIGDGPDEHTKHSLGDHISDRVADLLSCRGSGATDSHHLDNVDTWVSQPRHGGQQAGLADQTTCGLRLGLGGFAQTDEELVEDVTEWQVPTTASGPEGRPGSHLDSPGQP